MDADLTKRLGEFAAANFWYALTFLNPSSLKTNIKILYSPTAFTYYLYHFEVGDGLVIMRFITFLSIGGNPDRRKQEDGREKE